jgi:hypothetical protein
MYKAKFLYTLLLSSIVSAAPPTDLPQGMERRNLITIIQKELHRREVEGTLGGPEACRKKDSNICDPVITKECCQNVHDELMAVDQTTFDSATLFCTGTGRRRKTGVNTGKMVECCEQNGRGSHEYVGGEACVRR